MKKFNLTNIPIFLSAMIFLFHVSLAFTVESSIYRLGNRKVSANHLVPHLISNKYPSNGRKVCAFLLFAHHPQKKAIKKIMDRRPKKKRLSDINRNNQNLNKCITKFNSEIPDYTIVAEEDVPAAIRDSQRFWSEGDPEAEWHTLSEDSLPIVFSRGVDPLPVGGVPKHPPLRKTFPR